MVDCYHQAHSRLFCYYKKCVQGYYRFYYFSGGQQSTIFNSMLTVTVGGGVGGARSFSGVLAGLVVDGVRVLDLAAAGDPAVSVRGDARRAHTPLDRDINRMQQVCSI